MSGITESGEAAEEVQIDEVREVDFGETLVKVDGLKKYFTNESGLLAGLTFDRDRDGFPLGYDRSQVKAVDDVSFEIKKGETIGLVGESGCGKSTLARTLLHLLKPTEGTVDFKGVDLAEAKREQLREMRKDMQIIFQDPQSSLDPRMKVGPIVEEPMKAHGIYKGKREERTRELLRKVGLDPQHYNRYPHEFSGGQRQRINLARALSVNPDFIVCDEPTSSLDVSIQAQVLNTMRRLQREFGLTYLFISHDLSVIRHICDRVAVMYLGEIVELAGKEEIFENPQHPYTQALLDSIPVPDPRAGGRHDVLRGDVPSPIDPPSGCRFRTRCPKLIAPDEFKMKEKEWKNTLEFTRAVKRKIFEFEDRRDIENQFFRDGKPTGEAGKIIDDAIDAVAREEWDMAQEMLTREFEQKSICAQEKPDYEVETKHGDAKHEAACHLHR